MIVAEAVVARHVETGEAPFELPSDSASLTVIKPSGAVLSPAPTVTVTPGTSSATQELRAAFTADEGGRYDLVWAVGLGSSGLRRPETYFACWTDVYSQAAVLLGGAVSDADLDIVLAQTVESLPLQMGLSSNPPFSYNGVPSADRFAFDRALALMAAAWLRPFRQKESPVGEITRFQSGTDAYAWQPSARGVAQKPPEELWLDQALELLTGTSVFFQAAVGFQNVNVGFAASGRRRHRPTAYSAGPFGGPRLNPLYEMFSGWITDGAPLLSEGWRR